MEFSNDVEAHWRDLRGALLELIETMEQGEEVRDVAHTTTALRNRVYAMDSALGAVKA